MELFTLATVEGVLAIETSAEVYTLSITGFYQETELKEVQEELE